VSTYEAARVHRISAQLAQRLLAIAGVTSIFASPVLSAFVAYSWMDARLTRYEQTVSSGGLMAVIDTNGTPYKFTVTNSGDWQPDEGLLFEKLKFVVDCTRGLRLPRTPADRACWDDVWPVMGEDSAKKLGEYARSFGKDQAAATAAMLKHQVEVEILPGSTKSPDGRYRLQWVERERASGRNEQWSGTFVVSRTPATKEDVAANNAAGMRIDSFTWQRDQVIK